VVKHSSNSIGAQSPSIVSPRTMSHLGARPHSRSSHFQLLSGRGGSRPPSVKEGIAQHSGASHSSKAGVGMLDLERGRNRRDRTFVGSSCAVCEELLEHTLRGERILQLSCGHVSHEACIYELIRELDSQSCPTCDAPLVLDSNRGGNVLDIGGLAQPLGPFLCMWLTMSQEN